MTDRQGHVRGEDSTPPRRAYLLSDEVPQEARQTSRKVTRIARFSDHYGEWQARLSARLEGLDLAPDLAREIGSLRWLRGTLTLAALTGIALAAWPGFSPVEAAPAVRLDDRTRDEFRSQMIMPLALGGDSGKRMGATLAVSQLAQAPERPSLALVATLAQGDGFDRMLRRAGVSQTDAQQITGLVAQAIALDDIAAGTRVDITLGRRANPDAARPVDALSFRARFDLEVAVERRGGALFVEPRPILVDATPLRIRGIVGESLYRSARAAGAPPSSVQQYLRALGEQLDVSRELAPGDEFDMIIDYKRAATGEVEVGNLQYAAVIRNDRPKKQLMRWGKDGRFFEASGQGEIREGLIQPVAGPISSRFGMRRHPILGYRRMHSGIDFRAQTGTPIYAASDGRVEYAGRKGGYGNFVRLRHDGNLGTGYAHMSRMAVRSGETVKRGQVIGYVGSTGLSTGPHLHYEVYRGNQTVDPLSVKFVTRAILSGRELADFREQLVRLQRVEPGEALKSLAPDPSLTAKPAREIDRLEAPRPVN